jgi:hypothetical protein
MKEENTMSPYRELKYCFYQVDVVDLLIKERSVC